MATTAHRHAGRIGRAVRAVETDPARHGDQYGADAPWNTTLAAPIDAPTAGATRTATMKKIESPRRLSRVSLPERRWSKTAATSARAIFATSASTTQDHVHCGQCVTKC